MKKYLLVLVGLCCVLSYALAERPDYPELKKSDANIIGHVLDKKTKEHLPYITIALKGTTIGTVTDATGHYFLKNLPEGNFILEVSSVGYKTVTRNVTLKKGKTLEEDFEIEEDAIALDGVVVSANRSETTRRMAPTLVNVVDLKLFETTNSSTLSQGLNFQPGVRVETNCQNCGFQQVRINGLDGPYTQILIDSRPVFSALSGVYGLEQIPASMIERVEVMRGGGSALFGSSAIAGTINIITKEPLRNSGQLSHTITSLGGSSSFDNNTSLNASLVTDDHRAGLYIFGQNRYRSGYDYDGDGFTELPKLKNQTVGFRSYLKTSTYSKLTFEYHHMQEFRRGGDMLNRPPHEAHIAEQLQHSIDGGSLKFDYFSPDEKNRLSVFASAANTDRDSYYGPGNDPLKAYGKTTDLTAMGGAQYVHTFDKCFFMPSDLTAGLEYNRDRLKDNMWGYNRHTDQTVNIYSAFLQNEWKNDRWGILIGGRLDKHNMVDNVIFSPRANLRFNPTQNINLRLSYSSGFRAPQAFDEDMHIENVGGTVALKAYGKTTDLTAMGGAQYVHTFDKCFFMPSDLTAGLEYNRDRLKDNMWGYNRHTDQTVNIYSAFLQNEWKNDRWGILIGGRLDKHNMVDNVIFSPRANLRFNPTQNINLRLSYSSGFRAPQAFDEDMHIENVGGTVAMIERAKDLKEEKSQSFSVSADMYHRFGAFQTNLLIEGFYTRLTDVFVLGKPYDRGDGILVKTRSNGPGAKVMGLTLEGKVAYLSILQIQAGLTLQRSRYDEPHKWHDDAPAEKKIFRTPDTYGYFTATCTPIKPLSIALSGTYTGRMLVQRMDITAENAELGKMPERKAEAIRTPRFFDLGVKLAYDFKLYKTVDLQLNGGVQNIFESYQKDFDRGANRDSGYIYGPSLPRSFFAGVKISY